MLLIASAVATCSRKIGPTFCLWLPGWGVLIVCSHFYTWQSSHSESVRCPAGRCFVSPWFFLTLQPIIDCIKTEVPALRINAWYLDDSTLCGSPSDLVIALRIIKTDGPNRGLYLNRTKSLLYIPNNEDPSSNPLPSYIPITHEGFILLGRPIAPPSFCVATMMRRVGKV